jgi:predicted nucleic acid-binding protein
MKAVLLDTGYLLALELLNDQNHRAALKHWRSMRKALPPLVTTSYVFDEVVTYFNSRGYHSKAIEVGNRLLELHLMVKDTDVDIPVNRQQEIFESFTQADTSTTKN